MKNRLFSLVKWYHLVIAALLLYLIFFNGKEIVEVKIPSKENAIKIENPVPEVRVDTVEVEVFVNGKTIVKEKIVEVENPVNLDLLKRYEKAIDSIGKKEIFVDLAKERTYIENLEDSIQVIKVESNVVGLLKSQSISYKTKEKVIQVKGSEKRNKVYASVYYPNIQNLFDGNNFAPTMGLKLDLANKKNIYSLGVDSNKNVFVGFGIKLF